MPRAAEEAFAKASQEDGSFDNEVFLAEYQRGLAERHDRLQHDARAVFRALDGWSGIGTLEEWQAAVRQAEDDYACGQFLIDRLGAERYLDPTLMAVLLMMRRQLIDEHGAMSAAELMLVDMALLSYYHTLRINGWIGNFASLLEAEFFQKESLTMKLQDRYGRGTDRIHGLRVEEIVERLAEQLIPLLDRSNRMTIRNLRLLREWRQPPAPNVTVAQASQVNVAAGEQTNLAQTGGKRARRTR